MNGGSFDAGLLGLTNWVGNAVMPILAVLILALGIFKYSRGYHIEPYIAGTMSALSVSRSPAAGRGLRESGLGNDAVLGGDSLSRRLGGQRDPSCLRRNRDCARRARAGRFFRAALHRRRLDSAFCRRRSLSLCIGPDAPDGALHRGRNGGGGVDDLKDESGVEKSARQGHDAGA